MNNPVRLSSVSLLAASLFLSSTAFADAAARAKLVAERDAILVAFVQEAESRVTTGTGNNEQVYPAKQALYAFRRDNATTQEERIKNQELILQLLQEKLATEKTRFEAGTCTHLSLLGAKDQVLEAQIRLEDLRSGPVIR